MKRLGALKYLLVVIGPGSAILGFSLGGLYTWILPLYAFGLVPLVELFDNGIRADLSEVDEVAAKEDRIFDYVLYAMVPLQWITFLTFLVTVQGGDLKPYEMGGVLLSMGISNAVLGINVAHELGHRKNRYEKRMAKLLLLTSQYMHFFIEHNRGHHKNVGTELDPATARYGEWVYLFWIRSLFNGYLSAWKLEITRLEKQGLPWYHWKNEMFLFLGCQMGLLLVIAIAFSPMTMIWAVVASFIGITLLESINYVSHYGLFRNRVGERFDKVSIYHSWNGSQMLSSLVLFDVQRHSDHHCHAGRKYQTLRHPPEAPKPPTGVPGLILLSLIPPIWMRIMNPRVRKLHQEHPDELRKTWV